jgi:DGQHR domain-containing protein
MKIVPALVVKQWLNDWDEVEFQPAPPRRKPKSHFYVFSMSAYDLRRLSGIYRRDPKKPPSQDIGIQRRHIQERSDEILRYIEDGFPLSRISKRKLVDQNEIKSLRMPGWLPTAVVVNILVSSDRRGPKNAQVIARDLIQIEENGTEARIKIPDHCLADGWVPSVHPIEIIDGQHRLWALEEPEEDEMEWAKEFREALKSIEIPVVAFHGLDRTWQAYLFYTINQLPKRIDMSLVFDLYPLLRTEDWLMRFEGPEIYRDTRAQDLTIILWSHPESPWKDRILRHGGREKGKVTQASFIRSLKASFVKSFDPVKRSKVGGLFGSCRGKHELELDWAREQQAAFLIMLWNQLSNAVSRTKESWAELLRKQAKALDKELAGSELAAIPFSGSGSLLASDQGCRCVQQVMNDLFWLAHEDATNPIDLKEFRWERRGRDSDEMAVTHALEEVNKKLPKAVKYAASICEVLCTFDWRSSSAVDKNEPNAVARQASYRGSGGYRLLRLNTLEHLSRDGEKSLATSAKLLLELLGYEEADDE